MLAQNPRSKPRSIEEITRLIEVYPPEWRRWCNAPETGGCACSGCVRQPAPVTVSGDNHEYVKWPDERDALIQLEVDIYLAQNPIPLTKPTYFEAYARFGPLKP